MQSGMVNWLLTLVGSVDFATVSPGELANLRRDKTPERATGTADTIYMSVEDLEAACQQDVLNLATKCIWHKG